MNFEKPSRSNSRVVVQMLDSPEGELGCLASSVTQASARVVVTV